jgi:hypothetical protein
VTTENITPQKLILRLSAYFVVLISIIVIILTVHSDALHYLPRISRLPSPGWILAARRPPTIG